MKPKYNNWSVSTPQKTGLWANILSAIKCVSFIIEYYMKRLVRFLKWMFSQDAYDDWSAPEILVLPKNGQQFAMIMILLCGVIHIIAESVKIYYFHYHQQMHSFLHYVPEFLLFSGITTASLTLPYVIQKFPEFCPVTITNPQFPHSKQNTEEKFVTYLLKISFIVITFTIFVVLIGSSLFTNNLKGILFYQSLADNGPFYLRIISTLRYLIAGYQVFSTLFSSYALISFAWKVIYSQRFILDEVESICEYSQGLDSDELYYDEEFQRQLQKRLIVLIDYVTEVRFFARRLVDRINKLIPITFIFGVSVLSTFIVLLIHNHESTWDVLLFKAIMVLTFPVLYASLFWGPQASENMYDLQLRALIFSNWYQWNTRNKESYQMLLLMCQNPIRYKFVGQYCLNNEGVIKLARIIYTAFCLYLKLTARHNIHHNSK